MFTKSDQKQRGLKEKLPVSEILLNAFKNYMKPVHHQQTSTLCEIISISCYVVLIVILLHTQCNQYNETVDVGGLGTSSPHPSDMGLWDFNLFPKLKNPSQASLFPEVESFLEVVGVLYLIL
ncbi:hypothetical protein TNCV_1171051 [Trichonephila clavipes]|nr:hypothetical protein TNCV_1171051 [Trichonephila clavipes]